MREFEMEEVATRRTSTVPEPREARLVVMWEGERLELVLPSAGTVTVGRSRESDVRIEHSSISRTHLSVRIGDTITVEDAGSVNGSKLRGRLLAANTPVAIQSGDVVEVGCALLYFRFESDAPASTRRSTVDASMKRLQELVTLVSRGDISVVLFGETGVGKEVVAHSIHDQSPRAAHPIVAVNCAAVPESLFERELFGHERGAFTGATSAQIGLLEAAHGGTLFLDEVGEMPMTAQAKLLRVIERKEVTRIGSTKPTPIDVRFISATHRNLEHAIANGAFREDLYYRLKGMALVVPPLRERAASIAPLATRFLSEACAKLRRPAPVIGPDALRVLERHSWPGNVRELRNVMERAALVCSADLVGVEHVAVDPPVQRSSAPPPMAAALGEEIDELERRRILGALEECGGNQTLAAKRLGISRRKLLNRLDAYGVPRPRKRQ